MNSYRWCFTLNNYTDADIDSIRKWDTKYKVFGYEVGESGTPHLQGFVRFTKKHRLSGVKKLDSKAHWEQAKGTSQQASDYCKKEGKFEESGILSCQGKRTDLEKATDEIKAGVSLQEIAENHSTVFVKFGRGLRDLKLALEQPYSHHTTRGVWIYGPPGTGKSHAAREFDPNSYLKAQNKWFDGYNGESTVILDDLDTPHLGHHLKIWSDKYACTGETKGGTIHLQHRLFVVTSNHHPSELWPDRDYPHMCAAIERRFNVIHKTEKHQLIDYLKLTNK